MFVLVWSQVQHGSGSINHVMIAIRSIGLLLISAIPVDPITSYGIRFTHSVGDRSSSTLPHAKQHLLNLFVVRVSIKVETIFWSE